MTDWTDNVSAVVSAIGLFAALYGLGLWREQLRGTSKHATALEAATEARTLAILFFESRAPMYMAWEFPERYHNTPRDERTDEVEAEAWAHAHETRWKIVYEQILKVAQLRGKVGAVLGDKAAEEMEKLARKAKMLSWWMSEDVKIKRAGRATVAGWNSQDHVRQVPLHVSVTDTQDDAFSTEFNAILATLLAELKRHT
jgi:hypothetical protein